MLRAFRAAASPGEEEDHSGERRPVAAGRKAPVWWLTIEIKWDCHTFAGVYSLVFNDDFIWFYDMMILLESNGVSWKANLISNQQYYIWLYLDASERGYTYKGSAWGLKPHHLRWRTGELEISGEIDLQFFGENWSCSMGFQPTGSKHIMRYPISYANLSTGQRMGCGQFETKLEPVLYVSHNN